MRIKAFRYENKFIPYICLKKHLKNMQNCYCQKLKLNSNIKSLLNHSTSFCLIKQNTNVKNIFCVNYLQCLRSLDVLENHRKVCSEIDGRQSIKMTEKASSIKLNRHVRLFISRLRPRLEESIYQNYYITGAQQEFKRSTSKFHGSFQH